MAAQRQYATAGAFRNALEARLNERARRDAVDLHRLRRQVAFDRLLARMFDAAHPVHDGWVLKGGYALEMRFHMARSTKDLDLTVRSAQGRTGDSTSLRERLQLAASIELSDFFTFMVGEAMAELNQAPEGGARFPVDARLDGRTFVKFHVDLGIGDEVLEPLESVEGEDWLGFAGIPAVVVPALSVEQHWAEKFHAYTRPGDLRHLREQGLVETVRVPGYREQAVTLTKEGRSLLERHRDRDQGDRQTFYNGLKRERELEHDVHVYRAYERHAERLSARGGRIERVILDYELKREYQKWLHERDRDRDDYDGHPDRTAEEIREWALEHELPYFEDEVHFPDLRIEYELDGRLEHRDVEVTTEHYRGAYGVSVAKSGFSCYRGSSARVGGGSPFDPGIAEELV